MPLLSQNTPGLDKTDEAYSFLFVLKLPEARTAGFSHFVSHRWLFFQISICPEDSAFQNFPQDFQAAV